MRENTKLQKVQEANQQLEAASAISSAARASLADGSTSSTSDYKHLSSNETFDNDQLDMEEKMKYDEAVQSITLKLAN